MNTTTGRFITLDGSEGVGKSTQIANIAHWLEQQHLPYHLTREPGGTQLGEQLRQLLLDEQTNADPISELLIICAARRQHLIEVIWPRLAQGQWVICDRFNDATYAYQGYGRGIDPKHIARIENITQPDFEPDKRFIFGLPYRQAQQRLLERGNSKDRFEQEDRTFFERIEAGYRARAQSQHAQWIDASASPEQVFAQIQPHLEALLP